MLAALNICDVLIKTEEDADGLRHQIKDYLKDASFTRKQLEDVKKENELLKAELEKLRARTPLKEEEPAAAAGISLFEEPAPAASVTIEKEPEPIKPIEKESFFSRKKGSKGKKKESKQPAPIRGAFNEDAFSESADAAADIMSFFEEKAFDDED